MPIYFFTISRFVSPSLDRYDRRPPKFQLDESASPEPSPAIDAIIITSAHPSLPSTSTVQKPMAWLGNGPQPLGSGSTTACSIGGGGAPHTKSFQTPKLQASMAYARLSPCIESCVSLEQPKELRPCLTGVATRPPAAILSRTVCLEYPGTRSTFA